ncbi:sulfatase-like hydrolase/transferase, partial [bacterium]|nr:sulfatase-like hydrolase/transferase [bacterium]
MNRIDWNYTTAFLLCISLLTFFNGCRQPATTESPLEVRSLVDEFNKSWLQVGRDRFIFHDAVTRNKYLQTGWKEDDNPGKTRFPWPRFTETGGTVVLHWTQRMERRVKVRLVNIDPSYPADFVIMSLNGNKLTQMKDKLPVGVYEFYLPSSFQVLGNNTISIALKPGLFLKSEDFNAIGLHSLRITLGAVVRNTIRIGNQVRNSLLFAPPIALEIPYQGSNHQFLDFCHGLYSFSSSTKPGDYLLKITLYESEKAKVVFKKTIPIHQIPGRQSTWKQTKIKLPGISENGILEISFQSQDDMSLSTDYLALSELFLKPQQKNWVLKTKKTEADILLVTLSSVSTGQLGAYGNPFARTLFFDRLSRTGLLHTDVTASTNDENGSLVSIATGKYPRDHSVYKLQTTISKQLITLPDIILKTPYQSYTFAYSPSESNVPFVQMSSFRRIYLSQPKNDSLAIVQKQFENAVFSPYLQAYPGFYWMHLAPEISVADNSESFFPYDTYSPRKISISSLNLPVSEQERIIKYLEEEDEAEKDDLRIILSRNDERLRQLDKFLENTLTSFLQKRRKKSITLVITTDHGIIRSVDSNVFSADSLSEEVLRVPFIMSSIGKRNSPSQKVSEKLLTRPISNTRIFDILSGLIRHSDLKNTLSIMMQNAHSRNTISPIFSEHSQRPIV